MSNLRVLVYRRANTVTQLQGRKLGPSTQKNQWGKTFSKLLRILVWILAWILRGFFGTGRKGLKKSTRNPRQLPNKNPRRFLWESTPESVLQNQKFMQSPHRLAASSLCACLFQECVLKLSGSRTPGKCPQLGTGRAIEIFWAKKIHEKSSTLMLC